MIRIAHAYSNLLNLYGSYANLSLMERYITKTGNEVVISSFNIGSYIDLSSFDLIYFGAGTERRILLALDDFRRYSEELNDYLSEDKMLFVSGSSIAMLGKSITDVEGMTHEGLSLIDIDSCIHPKRTYTELLMKSKICAYPVIGNINSSMTIEIGNETRMFDVIKETSGKRKGEGVQKGSIYATEVGGPLLVRNPYLLHSFAEILLEKELPLGKEGWFLDAIEGYSRALLSLRKDLNMKGQ